MSKPSQPGRTYNQNHLPRPFTPGKRRFSIYWTWSYPWEANRDPSDLDNRFSTMTEVRRVGWPNYEGTEWDKMSFLQGIAGTLELFHRSTLSFQQIVGETTGHPVAVYQRIDQAGYKLPIDERVLADTDTTNLSPAIAGTDLYTHIRAMLPTTVPSILLAAALFTFIGLRAEVDVSTYDPTPALLALEDSFNITLWTLIPLVVVLVLAVRHVPAFVAIMAGALAGGIIAIIFQPEIVVTFANDPNLSTPLAMLKGVWASLATGFSIVTGYPSIDELVSRGGMVSMLGTVWLVLSAMSFGAIMDYTGMLRKLLEPLVRLATTAGRLMVSAGLTAIFINIFAGDQYMAIVLPGTIFREEFKKKNIAPQMLSRQIEDTATITSPLVPWNTCGAYMAATLGVATIAYLPYAFFNLINPLISFAFDLIGYQIKCLTADKTADAYAPEPQQVEQYGVAGYSVSKQAGGLAEQ